MEYKFKLLKSLIFSIYEDEYSNNEINQTIKNILSQSKKIKKIIKNFKKNDEQDYYLNYISLIVSVIEKNLNYQA